MMQVLVMELTFRAPWVHSLKEKRSEVKAILSGLRRTFAVSAAEISDQELHQTIGIGVAALVADRALGDGLKEKLTGYLEREFEPELVEIRAEYR